MSNGGIDGFDWLQSFLPADSQPDHDPTINNEGYQTHRAFHDAEELAKAALMHQQAQRSYSFMRSTSAGTNHALESPPAYSHTSDAHYGGNKNQQNSNIQFNNPPSSHATYPTDRSHYTTQRPNPPGPPQQQHLATQAHQDAYRHGQTRMGPAGPPQRPSGSIPNFSEAYQGTYRVHETTRPTVPAQRMNPPMTQAVPPYQSPHQGYSSDPKQNSQMLTQMHIAQRMTTQVQITHAKSPSYSNSTIPPHNAQRSPHSTAPQATRPTRPVQRTHSPAARPQVSQRPCQSYSTTLAQNTQQLSVSTAARRPGPPGPGPAVRTANTSLALRPCQSHSTTPTQNAQRLSHPNAPPSPHSSIDTGPLMSPKGFKIFAARTTLETRQSLTPARSNCEASNPTKQNPATNSASSNPISPEPPFYNQDRMQPIVSTAPDRVHSPAIPQSVSTRSPSVSIISPAPASASAPPAPPAQTTTVPPQLDKGWSQEKHGSQGKAAATSSYQSLYQTSQQPPKSQPNEQSTPAGSSAFASSTPSAASHSGPSYTSLRTSGPRVGTFSDSAVGQQPAGRNHQSQNYPLPGPLHHQKKRWVPAEEHSSDSIPFSKTRLLDNGKGQIMTLRNDPFAGSSVPGAQVPMEHARPRGPGKILKNRDDLVQQIRPSDALPKKSYDPTTVARDVLIAAGRHPTEKHLNHHLEALRRNFTKIDYCADLETFRWDLVDVKQPEPQVDRMPPVSAPQIARPLHPQRQLLPRDPASISRHVIARDHAPAPSRDTPPNRQVAMRERIDARAPPGGFSPWGTLPFKSPTYHSPKHIFSSNLPSGLPRVDPVPASPKFSSNKSVPFPVPPPRRPHPQPQPRQHSTTDTTAPPEPSPETKEVTPKSTTKPKPQGQTVKSQSDSGRTVKSPEARRLPQPQVVIPLSPARMPTKRRPGRPAKSAANNIEVAIHREPPVHYQIFPCKWEGCAAELHNIDSVRAHVIKVHIPHSLVCKWKDCSNKTPMAAADMFQHLATEHISKMAWELGDGPTVLVTAENKSNHPSVLGNRSARKGTMVLPVDEHQVKAFSKAHGKSTEKTKAQALLEAGRHWKQQIGPEMDWSDRRLSTPARQSRVHTGEMAFVGEN
ncbi:unnamed protein product [Penicillium egyptiacum]|uniref:C2H2-type domain-containing protein n=1 Tax=Penicillium egyptiacum TaxID=1303716 RepID=A0A9W4KDM8_9EURO|nr:unnamed protein product [Penicillium egyptiacum]